MQQLSGITVVVTRPAHQAEKLCKLIEAEGGVALRFPVIDIAPPQNVQKCQAQMGQLAEYDLAIFISSNAVTAALELMDRDWQWPKTVSIAAVGKSTAQALEKNRLTVKHVAPVPFNSEALLSLPDLQNIKDTRILIFRGNSGRELLRNRLRERGATVDYIECYQRVIPHIDPQPLYEAWKKVPNQKTSTSLLTSKKDVKLMPMLMPIVVTSSEGLKNLVSMVNPDHLSLLLSSPLVMISERTANLSVTLGFSGSPTVATAANDEAILEALKTWALSVKSH
ncbi:MAG: uroporphyrinogen-III synthase [Ectothiorhodospiraceae bacterium]|nr:uroporphyrinogen-III synthase [Ectothiorhodospiraceae bacterium]